MGALKEFLNTSTPMVKMFMAVGITTALFVGHRWLYEPYARRQRYQRAEQWARMIIEKEESESNDHR